MSSYGFLQTSELRTPLTVRLELSDENLTVIGGGQTETLALGGLRKVTDDGSHLQIGRRGKRSWKLTVSGPIASQLRSVIGHRTRGLKWGAARTWHALVFILLLVIVELVKIPPEWLAPVLPAAVEKRLISQDVRPYFGSYCNSPEGEQVVRALIGKFDEKIARSVTIQVATGTDFIISALPDDRLVISNAFIEALEPDEFAALLAHEIAHMQQHDAVRAALRANGTLGALVGTLSGTRTPEYNLEFSNEEEWSADNRAIQMLRSANISTLPAAELFARMEVERKANRSFGKEQYYLHWGYGSVRAENWRDAQDQIERAHTLPALNRDQADALFNYCWRDHQGPPRHALPKMAR